MTDTAQNQSHETGHSSPDRLIRAVIAAWERRGSAHISVRSLSDSASLPTSSLYHYFGGLEHLFLSAQEHARQMASAWCAGWLQALPSSRLAREAFPPFLAATIDDWTETQRPLAFAWRECQLLAARDARYRPAAQRWQALWDDFWQEAGSHFDLPSANTAMIATQRLFDGEGFLHMMRWRRLMDRAGLEEVCRGWGAWLNGDLAPPAPWRDFAQAEAGKAMTPYPQRDDMAERIAAAAADVLARSGVAGVTHRAVAQAADVTLGLVSYKFRTSSELLRGAFETIYRQSVSRSADALASLPDDDRDALIRDYAGFARLPGSKLATDELFLAAARDTALQPFAAQLRYLRGATSRHYLQAIIGQARSISPLDAAILSSLTMGQIRAHMLKDADEREAAVQAELAMISSRF